MAYKTKNPALNDKTFDKFQGETVAAPPMTLEGTVQKSALLLALTVGGAAFSWYMYASALAHNKEGILGVAIGAALVAFVIALVQIFKNETSPYLAPFYAVFEGLTLGALSAAYEAQYHGIVINAVGLTFGTFAAMLAAYQSKLIQPTEKFKIGVVAATAAIAVLYIVDLVLKYSFGMPIMLIHDSGPIGIIASAVIVIVAALNLILDFDFIEKGVAAKAPKYMEWYAGFGLLVTLVWLYLEILRMLAKARNR